MSASPALDTDPAPLEAITISRDVQEFDLLIDDMDAEVGEGWGDLTLAEAATFLTQQDAADLKFVVVAVDEADEGELPAITAVVRQAKKLGLQVVLVADGLGPLVMHELLRAGTDDFAPYPLPEGALAEAVARVRAPRTDKAAELRAAAQEAAPAPAPIPAAAPATGGGADGAPLILAFQSIAGGAGASTIATNVAHEIAEATGTDGPSICVLDLGLQFGSVATYMDLPRRESIIEILADTAAIDEQAFRQALQTVDDRIHVFTAPDELLPLDMIGPDDVSALIDLAGQCFDVVIVDMPGTLTQWTDTVIDAARHFHVVLTPEVRAAQNALRLVRLMQAEELSLDRITWVANRVVGRAELAGKGRIERMAESLGIAIDVVLPDGGAHVTDANDQAVPVAGVAARNPFRREVAAFAARLLKDAPAAKESKPKRRGFAFLGLKFG
ncbi:AAA family ATPase [Jannaschia sp. LMIT008]|uniref:AAA family ATPase n=1 Tax=Jannaschia maritima TaxID=3032585 RepID=UPI0028119DD0|nr:AAA family ATPase [Jannaschia sp. LMIT008]